ncbi:GntR family transcriptional regulator [Solwaraspora sp. WMMD1047]|uniref:GntR family transcriptional regulator n=1 Tax=Solwaraspora sp. WMMD1047 TaxID=3016102 RepID=UPI002417D57B|nr:GntR family transcriptional regulator [Solwaraspora sp. WMMD1047]MDG4829363.1 GntR family transcriptional regulator [Solwaraspora sp. WMMD1047]
MTTPPDLDPLAPVADPLGPDREISARDLDGAALELPRRPSLRADVTRALRTAIITGRLRPGQVYSAPKLAERFGVSATPVREAMLELVKDGLLETLPNKGFRIAFVSDREMDDIARVRCLLEAPTIGEVARHGDLDRVRRLRSVAETIVAAATAGDLAGYLQADLDFHLGLLAVLDNRRLVEIVRDLRARTRLYGLTRLAETGRLTASAAEHLELLDLIEARDAVAAEALMRRHIGHTRGIWAGRPAE